jgi:hypothetical protein
MFLGQHDDLAGAGLWLAAVERHCGRDGCRAVTDALRQATETLALLQNGRKEAAVIG